MRCGIMLNLTVPSERHTARGDVVMRRKCKTGRVRSSQRSARKREEEEGEEEE